MASTFNEFGQDTRDEASALGKETLGSITGLYTGTVDDIKEATDVRALKEDAYAAGVATTNLGNSATSLVSSIGSSGDAYAELGATAGLVAQDILVQKLEELRSQLFELRTIKLKSLLSSTGAFVTMATTPTEFIESITANTAKTIGSIPKALKKAATELAVEVGSDPRVLKSLASLKEIQQLSKTLDAIYRMYSAVKKIADKFEPFFPILEITVTAAMIWCTGGGAAAKVSSESAQLAMQELKKIIPLIAKPMKDYIYNKEIKVPAMLIGMMDTYSSQEASDRFAALKQEAEEYLLADDARYTEINNDLKFPGVYNRLTSTVITRSSLAQAFVEKYLGGSPLASTLVRTVLASSSWAERRSRGDLSTYSSYTTRKALTTCIQDFELRDKDIRRISTRIVDNRDTTAAFYTDRQMHKLVIAELANDGCIVDLKKEAYDELGTFNLPEGDRLAFKLVNDRIIGLHKLLKGICGEHRANIQETIPVIDFYQRTYSGVLNRYTDEVDFDSVEPVSGYTRDAIDAPSAYESILNEEPSLINMAIDCYPVAEYFYNTKARIADEKNLVVEYTGNLEPTAPGLLNGLFSTKVVLEEATEAEMPAGYEKFNAVVQQLNRVTNDNKPTRWVWADERDEVPGRSSLIDLGTLYFPYHIRARGTIVPRPLETATVIPGSDPPEIYPGRATEYYAEAKAFVEALVTSFTIPAAEWATLGNRRVTGVTTKAMGSGLDFSRQIAYRKSSGALWWKKKETRYKTVTTHVDLVDYPVKLKNLDTIDASYWTGLNVDIGGQRWLQINADDETRVLTSISANAGYGYKNGRSTITSYNGNITVTPVSVAGYTTTGSYGTPVAEPALDFLAMEPNRHIAVALNPDNPYVFLTGGAVPKPARIRNIRIITPLAMFGALGDTSKDMVIFSPSSEGVDGAIWLASRNDLGFNTATGRVLASFTKQGRSMALEVTEVHHIDPETERIRVKYNDTWYEYYPGMTHGYTNYVPRVEIVGGACWLYKLEAIQTVDAQIRKCWTPIRSHADFFNWPADTVIASLLNYSYIQKAQAKITILEDAVVAVNIPELSEAKPDYSYFSKLGTSYEPFNSMFTETAYCNYVAGAVADHVIMTDAVSSNVTVGDFSAVLDSWIHPLAKNALYGYMPQINGLSRVPQMINRFEILAKSIWTLMHNKITPEICADIDSKLGNGATPWLAIGTAETDDISDEALGNLVQVIKTELLGTASQGTYPVRFLEGDERATGRADSLYYQRYMFLNARMHRTEGALAKSAYLLYNWQIVKNARTFQDAQTENYTDFLDALAVPQVDTLMYSPPKTEGEEGRFYLRELLDDIKAQISDKCMLVCAPCPVKDSCPFYDEDTVLYMYVPPATTLDLYIKDNELDLLVYEQDEAGNDYLNVSSSTGTRLSATQMKERHKVYTEIIHDEDEELNLDFVREEVANRVNGFKIQEGLYVDGLDWLHGGRYGTIVLATEGGEVVSDLKQHKYLYDALFIRDQETNIIYGETAAAYPVSFDTKEGGATVTYSGAVRLKKPIDITLSRDAYGNPIPLSQASGASELWLVSDDEVDEEGNPMVPMIYMNTLNNLHYDFEFMESGETIDTDTDKRYPGAGDIAQWVINDYKWMDPTEDKYWMPSVTKVVRASKKDGGTAVINLPGRPRVFDVVDPLIDEEPPVEDILRGKPYVRNYINFVRKVRFQLSDIRWTKDDNRSEIETKKKQLASMKTNLRLVLVKK